MLAKVPAYTSVFDANGHEVWIPFDEMGEVRVPVRGETVEDDDEAECIE